MLFSIAACSSSGTDIKDFNGTWRVTKIVSADITDADNALLNTMMAMMQLQIDTEKSTFAAVLGGKVIETSPLKLLSSDKNKFIFQVEDEQMTFEIDPKDKNTLNITKEGEKDQLILTRVVESK